MASTALKKINSRAKQICKAHPGKSYRAAQVQAGREYREGKMSGVKKKKGKAKKRRGRMGYAKVHNFKKPRRMVNVTHYAEGVVGSVSYHRSQAKKQIEGRLSKTLLQLEKRPKAKIKRKLIKKKQRYKSQLNALGKV